MEPRCIWLTGLPGAGKTTLARALAARLVATGRRAAVLDGDALRLGLCRDLGFSEADRAENVRRVAEVARLMLDAGLFVLVALVSPIDAHRRAARALFPAHAFLEVFVDAPREECERRDPKGMYARARSGEMKGFTGVGARYEPPARPDVRVETAAASVEDCVEWVLRGLDARRIVPCCAPPARIESGHGPIPDGFEVARLPGAVLPGPQPARVEDLP